MKIKDAKSGSAPLQFLLLGCCCRSVGRKRWKRLSRLGFLMLFAAISQQFLQQAAFAGEHTGPDDVIWYGSVPYYSESGGTLKTLDWIQLERLG